MPDFLVENMTCGHCVAAVTGALHAVDPAASVLVDLAAGRVAVASAVASDRLAAAITAAGYPVKPA